MILKNKDNIIFYGAGSFATANIKSLKKVANPICFVDQNEMHHHKFIDDIEVLSLDNALSLYPNAYFLVTMVHQNESNIIDYLIKNKNIPPNKILRQCDFFEIHKGCAYLNQEVAINGNKLEFCCMGTSAKKPLPIPIDFNYPSEAIEKHAKLRKNILTSLKNQVDSDLCKGCVHLIEGIYPIADKIQVVNIAGMEACQFRCIYCPMNDSYNGIHYNEGNIKLLQEFISRNMLSDNVLIRIGGGEPTIQPHADELFRLCSLYPCQILTNAGHYSKSLFDLLSNNKNSHILVSMDSGTRETFKKVKRVDLWEKTVDNLIKYSKSNGRILLKYILLPGINDNKLDLDGFINLAFRINTSEIYISSNTYDKNSLEQDTIDIAKYIISQARKKNISVKGLTYGLSTMDIEKLQIPCI